MEEKRSYGRILLVSVLVVCLEAALAVVVGVLYALTRELPHFDGGYTMAAVSLLAIAQPVVVVALVLSLVVLPAVALSDLLGRLIGGRDAWGWVPVAVGAVLSPLAGLALVGGWERSTVLVTWSVSTAVLSVAALLGRPRRAGLFGLVAKRGTALVVGIGLLGSFLLWTEILPKYRPPLITPADVAGTWSDQRGGGFTFEPDGRLTATGVSQFRPGDSSHDLVRTCSGPGTWTFTPGRRNTWGQRVVTTVPGCSLPEWRVAGRPGSPELYRHVGDPDTGDLYELKKRG
ncbi:hypothetical protein ACFVGY_15960 [Streptomyces sp. NPDC127106]|uniref:hypothetical protein n=1 Tax=Streptomyces sp. NPDC127106 TaxID=3345360 RepID=UPI00364211CC